MNKNKKTNFNHNYIKDIIIGLYLGSAILNKLYLKENGIEYKEIKEIEGIKQQLKAEKMGLI